MKHCTFVGGGQCFVWRRLVFGDAMSDYQTVRTVGINQIRWLGFAY